MSLVRSNVASFRTGEVSRKKRLGELIRSFDKESATVSVPSGWDWALSGLVPGRYDRREGCACGDQSILLRCNVDAVLT